MDNVVFRLFFFRRSQGPSRKGCGRLLELVENALCCFPQFQWFPSAGFGVWGAQGGKGLPLNRHEDGPSLELRKRAEGRGRLRVSVPPRVALVPLTDVRADTVSAGGSVSRPLPRFDARRDASRLGLDLACGCRSEARAGLRFRQSHPLITRRVRIRTRRARQREGCGNADRRV